MEPHNDHVLAIGRYHEGQAMIALFNVSTDSQMVAIQEEGNIVNLLTAEHCSLETLILPDYSFRWLIQKSSTSRYLLDHFKMIEEFYKNW